MSYDCLECRQEFDSQKSLHIHLKKHGGMESYYHKFYPRRDLFTGELIKFKNLEQYLSSFFNSFSNQIKFLDKGDGAKEFIKKEYELHFREKGIDKFPSHNYICLSKLSPISYIKKYFGSCYQFCQEVGVEQIFVRRGFCDSIPSDMNIFVDTREQKPFRFENYSFNKLDFGDYTASGEHFSKTFIDRKSINDFKGTFGVGYERFRREIKRCVDFDSYLFVVVEGSIKEVERQNYRTKFKTNLAYAFHNVRQLLRDYPNNLQFVFCKDRSESKSITMRLLAAGKKSWDTDIQYILDGSN